MKTSTLNGKSASEGQETMDEHGKVLLHRLISHTPVSPLLASPTTANFNKAGQF